MKMSVPCYHRVRGDNYYQEILNTDKYILKYNMVYLLTKPLEGKAFHALKDTMLGHHDQGDCENHIYLCDMVMCD